jgi:ubiquinol-cytochrome c reductase cytochrome b subunit
MIRRLFRWLDQRLPISSTWKRYASEYYVPKNLNLYYCFGALAIVILLNQWVSGVWLTMFFTPTATGAFASIEYIMRDVAWGWLLRYLHSTGASALFIILYIHIFRGLLYGSYQRPRELVWLLGCGLFFLMMLEAFMGYLLPWGQMSYWGAQVITSIFGAIPYIGDLLMTWLRGGAAIGEPTLQRFFALHVAAVPLFLLVLIYLHIVALHKVGSNNPEGIEIYDQLNHQGKPLDGVPFYPKYVRKDLLAISVFLIIFFSIVFFAPDFNGYFLEPDNFIEAQNLVTPSHIKPMWYMTPFYAMLRAVPHKLGGIFVLFSALFLLCYLPWLDRSKVKSMRYKGLYSKIALSMFCLSFMLLGYLGLQDLTQIKQLMAQICTVFYFAYFLLMPVYTRKETCLLVPDRIANYH